MYVCMYVNDSSEYRGYDIVGLRGFLPRPRRLGGSSAFGVAAGSVTVEEDDCMRSWAAAGHVCIQ